MNDLCYKSAVELAELIKTGELSPVELIKASYEQINKHNPTLNAVIALRPIEQAIAEAKQIEQRLTKGESLGTLAGLPLLVKDLEDTKGFATTYGSLPFKNNFPDRDSFQVERLKNAGAIVIGKTNTPEFGYTAFTDNLIFGVTRNPWNPERTPGGSSGGSAVAVVTGMAPLATGSDAGGSIRIPACFTGCYGIKPTYGRVPIGPREMLSWSQMSAHGPITRSVRDAALYLDAVVGAHPGDPSSLPHPNYSYSDILKNTPQKLRIAWSPTLGYAEVQKDVLREVSAAVKTFENMGHVVEEVEHVCDDLGALWFDVFGGELYANLKKEFDQDRDQFCHVFALMLEYGSKVTAEQYGNVQRQRIKLVYDLWRLFENYDVLLTPTLPTEPFTADGKWPKKINDKKIEDLYEAIAFTYPFNYSGHPAASIPAGLTDSGLPCGLQIIAPRHREDLILQLSYAYEQHRPWNHFPKKRACK